MPFSLDPEIATGLTRLTERFGAKVPVAVGDVETRRRRSEGLQQQIHAQRVFPDDVTSRDYHTVTSDGTELLLRWYETAPAVRTRPAVLYIHGGGMIQSNVGIYDITVAHYVSETCVPFLSVEYRYAPEFPAPIPVTDCFAGLVWLSSNARELGVDPTRIAVMGDSGGGGVAASLAIYARDQSGPTIAKQILIYPMLDDRNTTPDPLLATFASWSYDDNATGWGALLGSAAGAAEVSPYGAAARVQDFAELPPAYIDVGELDIFRAESVTYAQKLLAAGVSTELHVYPGATHAFEAKVPDAEISKTSLRNRARAIRAL